MGKPLSSLVTRSKQWESSGMTPAGRVEVAAPGGFGGSRTVFGLWMMYPPVNCHITIENHHFSWENSL